MSKKKKAAKKKAGKKKASKKKTSKKKAAKKRAGVGMPIKITGSVADKPHARVKKRKPEHSPDSVFWKSADISYTVTFTTGWPFQRLADIAPTTILVPALGESKTFTVDDDAKADSYGYDINPKPPSKPGQPLPTPEVDVDA